VTPGRYLDFVEPLITDYVASGVIGTDVTVLSDMAAFFALSYFTSFISEVTIGEAARTARLDLLSRGNPLGLVYNFFVLPELRLERVAP
jgi:hypothetical protein